MTGSPATRSSAAPRRSGRERKKVDSIYDEAAKTEELSQSRSVSPSKKEQNRDSSVNKRGSKRTPKEDEESDADAPSDDDDDEQSNHSSSESESEDEDDASDDEFQTSKKSKPTARGPKTKIRTGRSPAAASAKKSTKQKKRTTTTTTATGKRTKKGTAKTAAQRTAHQALATLAKNVLPEHETPGLSSLVAGLLHSYRPTRESSAVELGELVQQSEYTPNLVALARKVVEMHNDNPNRAQLALLNLLFRSVGGGPETDLSMGLDGGKQKKKSGGGGGDASDSELEEPTDMDLEEEEEEDGEVILDELDTEEWAGIITDLVDEMRHSPANQILICADPRGAVHQAAELAEREKRAKEDDTLTKAQLAAQIQQGAVEDVQKGSVGAMEYRKIYQEFWYVLGHLSLTEGGMATTKRNEFESQKDDDASEDSAEDNIVRLDAELVKGLLLRIIELSPVGQPDVRAASTLAALSISHAVLDQSAVLVKKFDVASRQYTAATKGKKSPNKGGGAKAEALKVRMESLKRSVEDLEEVVLGPVVQGLFVHRYRDSNEHIRAMCLQSLSRYTLQRPDIFLNDKYLKYFGWMTHDKIPAVRCNAFRGILAPFTAAHDLANGKPRAKGDENLMIEKMNLSTLEHVIAKFMGRISSAVMDPVGEVQEVAMSLMLVLLRDGFLDDVNEDSLWDQTNQRSLAFDAPANVQRDSLYFILEQLEAFDDGGENEKAQPNERKRAQQLDAIASYAAHTLTNGPVPIDKVEVKVADLLVKSLRDMPEHRGLVTDWSAMLRAIKDDSQATTAHQVTAGDRANVAKQRVLVRMLACAAREEVGSVADEEFLHRGTDADVSSSKKDKPKSKGKGPNMGREHENLSIALLKALPNLLIQFKGDSDINSELASLPRFLIPTVFSLPQRKQDYMSLIKNLGEIYLSSSDDKILDNTACSLVSLCKGDHARVPESKAQLRKVVSELRDRIVELMSSDDATVATSAVSLGIGDPDSDFTSVAKSRRRSGRKKTPASSPASDKTSLTDDHTAGSTPDSDTEYSIFLNLKRLKILSKKCDLSVFFDDRNDVNQLELLCNFISDGLKSRLRACKPVDLRVGGDDETTKAKLIDGPEILGAIGKGVGEGLEFLLCVIAWATNSAMNGENLVMEDDDIIDNMDEEDDEASVEEHAVVRLRHRLLSTLELCFAQYIPNDSEQSDDDTTAVQHSEDQHSFSDFVQLAAGKVTSDMRTLFPKEFADAASPLLRSFALREDGRLIGAYVRFLDSKDHQLRENDVAKSAAERSLSQALLLPMARAVSTNWNYGNRREAGVFLRHISASGPTAADIASTTSRCMKKIDPVRMLESQMASLRQSYENWVDDTPELDSDRPSEDEMIEFENEEKHHKEQFENLEHRASQFSQTLGVFGKFSSAKLGPALNGFMREGIRFSFSNIDENGEDSLVLGSRLSFLLLLSKYAQWAKKNKKNKAEIQDYVDELETNLCDHEEFEDVHNDDLECLASFRQTLGLKALPEPKSGASVISSKSGRSARSGASVASGFSHLDDDESLDSVGDSISKLPSPAPSTGRSAGSRASRASRISSTLPTLPEAEKEESPDGDHSDSDTHFSESPPLSSSKKRSQSQMSDDQSVSGDESDASSVSRIGMEEASSKKKKKTRRG